MTREHTMTELDSNANNMPDTLPSQVFHYTSLDVMMKIVDKRSIWCTALPYLNDSKERTFLVDAVKRRLPFLKKKDSSIDPNLGWQTISIEDVKSLTSFADEPFVACFAENSDSLMHWRAYCPRQNGVAIGFKSVCLREARIAETPQAGMVVPPVFFDQVGYLDVGDDSLIDSIIYDAYEVAKKYASKNLFTTLNEHFRWNVEANACMRKLKAFEVEDELRLLCYVRSRENNIQFRTVRSTVIPFMSMKIPSQSDFVAGFNFAENWAWNAIKSVVIGPTANMALTRRSVEAFFALHGMDVEVLASQVPYRDW